MGGIYGRKHDRVRARVKEFVQAGQAVCARCGKPISAGEPWDLGHVDGDPGRYSGPEHRKCNRSTKSHAKQRVLRVSRLW